MYLCCIQVLQVLETHTLKLNRNLYTFDQNPTMGIVFKLSSKLSYASDNPAMNCADYSKALKLEKEIERKFYRI